MFTRQLKDIPCTNCGGIVDESKMECCGCGSKCTVIHGGSISIPVFIFKCRGDKHE